MGANSEGAESWSELEQHVSSSRTAVTKGNCGSPQNQSAILDSSASVLVCLADKVEVDGAANAAVFHGLCIDPCVDNQARAGLQIVGVAMLERRVESVQESCNGDLLRGRRRRPLCVVRHSRVDRHARGVANKAHLGQLRAGRPFRVQCMVRTSGFEVGLCRPSRECSECQLRAYGFLLALDGWNGVLARAC